MINVKRTGLLLLLAAGAVACGTLSVGNGDAQLAVATADAYYDSTDKLRFEIEQTSHPMMLGVGSDSRADVSFRITITNKTKAPVTVNRLTLQSIGGSIYAVDTTRRKFNTKIAPQARESFKFWATARATDRRLETDVPLVIRTTVDGLEGDEPLHAVFNRRVNGVASIGIGSQ